MASAQQQQQQQQQRPVHVCHRDAVKGDGVLKEQVRTEEQAKRIWDRKWYFMRDFYKTYLEEAAKQGLSEEEFLKLRTTKIRPKDMEVDGWVARASLGKFPVTSSAMVGWRSSRAECSMERFGPLYISPRHTVTEPDRASSPTQQCILLG